MQQQKEKKTIVKKEVKQEPLKLILNAIIITPEKKNRCGELGPGKKCAKNPARGGGTRLEVSGAR